ncbi:MAG: hypothetical protein ACRD1Z_18315, partial [Vicinamibacteria bacterium]
KVLEGAELFREPGDRSAFFGHVGHIELSNYHMTLARIFLLSPASLRGKRAGYLMEEGDSELARRLRSPEGAALGELFTFVSSLYFRGKLAYAGAFANPPPGVPGALVITPGLGLKPPEERINLEGLRRIARVPIDADDGRYRTPLERDARDLAERAGPAATVVLLGSVATAKYADVLLPVFGSRLRFPAAFVGRGDMSRGGLMLRCASERKELEYAVLRDAVRHGPRPPRLPKKPRVQ